MSARSGILAALLALAMCPEATVRAQGAKAPDPFDEATIRVKGFGRFPPGQEGTPRGKLMAGRAAKIDAMRNVAALFGNMEIRGDDGAKKIVVSGFISGAREVGDLEVKDGWVIVTLEVPLSAMVSDMAELHEKVSAAQKRNEQLQEALGKADSNLTKMRETLDKLEKAIEDMEARPKEVEK